MNKAPGSEEVSRELIVGTVALMILLAMAYFTIVVGRQKFWQTTYPIQVYFDNVMGLRDGDDAILRGMPDGKVRGLKIVSNEVCVTAELMHPPEFRTDYRIRVMSTSVLGGHTLEIVEGSLTAPLLPPGTRLHGERPVNLLDEATDAIREVRFALTGSGIVSNLAWTVVNLRDVTDRVRDGHGTVGKLLADESVYNDLQAALKDVRDTAGQLKQITTKVNQGEGTIGKLLADDTVYRDIRGVSSNLLAISDRLERGEGTLGKLLSSDDRIYRDVAASVASISNITARLERGDGLLGKLLTDESLATNAVQAVSALRSAIDDFRETSPVISFSSFLFGAF